MTEVSAPQTADAWGGPLLGAYELVLGVVCEGGSDEDLLRRALAVVATVPWPSPHRRISASLVDPASGALRLAASVGNAAEPGLLCQGVDPARCVCGQAVASGRAVTLEGVSRGVRPPCEPLPGCWHLAMPLAGRRGVRGVIHIVLEPGEAPAAPEAVFLSRVASLLGTELQRRALEEEHQWLETRFLQAQKLEAVGRLAGGVAHDFNNILTAITSYAELGLLRLDGAHPLRRNLEEILTAADRAALLSQQLLAFSRHQFLAPRPVDLGAVLAETGKMLRRLLGEDVDLELRSGHGVPRVLADPVHVEQVIVNIALAARDALPHGGRIAIEVAGARQDAAEGACLTLAFTAEGSPLPPRTREAPRWPPTGCDGERLGSGLGLAAVRGIVERCGGNVHIEAAPGDGTISAFFPGCEGAQVAAVSAPPRGVETILLAEDDESVRCVIGECLRDLGYRVIETRGGKEALAAATAPGPIDLLLADVVMPAMSGMQLHRELAGTRGTLRVLYVSGCTDEVLAHHGIHAAGAQLLRKPFSPGMLAERVRRALDAPPPAP